MVTPPYKVDRGGGIHVVGDFRLSNITLSFDQTTGELADSSMTPALRTDTFAHSHPFSKSR